MKPLGKFIILSFLLFCTSCAYFTGGFDDVGRDEFFNKLPMINEEILGNLKYDDPTLNLQTLAINSYDELFSQLDMTDDYQRVIAYIDKSAAEKKFLILKDTFVVCLRSEKKQYLLCDDAESAGADHIEVGSKLPQMDAAFERFSKAHSPQ